MIFLRTSLLGEELGHPGLREARPLRRLRRRSPMRRLCRARVHMLVAVRSLDRDREECRDHRHQGRGVFRSLLRQEEDRVRTRLRLGLVRADSSRLRRRKDSSSLNKDWASRAHLSRDSRDRLNRDSRVLLSREDRLRLGR